MPLARAWWRGSAWALAATLVVPGALAIAVATIALGGGLRSLGAVAQIVNGPEVPEAQLNDHQARTTAAERPSRLPEVPRSAAAVATATRAFRAPVRGTAPATTRRGATPTRTSTPAPVTRRPATGTTPSRPSTAAPSSGPATQPTSPGQNDDVVRQTGKAVAGTAGSTVPAPAGPAAADAVTTVLDLVDPPKATAAPAVPAP